MKKKGFTLIELLVVIAIIAMLLAILMPALNKVKRLAQRLVCCTNLKGMGTALMVYSNDDKYEQYPVQGGSQPRTWSTLTQGWADIEFDWDANANSMITTSASLYLLVREADVDPKSFVCKSSDQKAYEGQLFTGAPYPDAELVELWDFGNDDQVSGTGAGNCVSYAYQLPYESPANSGNTARPANSTASAQFALMADRNPWYDDDLESGTPDKDTWQGMVAKLGLGADGGDWEENASLQKWTIQVANSNAHNREGQNVLFNDGHAEFEKRPDVGIQNDNIYTFQDGTGPTWDEDQRRIGGSHSKPNISFPKNTGDSYLVNDINAE